MLKYFQRYFLLFTIILISLLLSSCGQYGSLYLPNKKQDAKVLSSQSLQKNTEMTAVESDTP